MNNDVIDYPLRSEVVQDMMLGTPDAPCSGFMREMQVHVHTCIAQEGSIVMLINLFFLCTLILSSSLSLAGSMLNTSQSFSVKKKSATSKTERGGVRETD